MTETNRNPHRIMAAHVAEHGTDCAKDLYDKSREFNRQYFAGQLHEIFIEIASPASPNAYATHQPHTPEGVECAIRIAPGVVADGALFAHDVLLHEMIHVWQFETSNSEPGYQGHGPKYAAECNRIGALLGLPEVSAKGKDGKPDCAQWPLNVRPAGYYGNGVKAGKAVARATRGKQTRAAKAPPLPALAQILALLPELSQDDRDSLLPLLA